MEKKSAWNKAMQAKLSKLSDLLEESRFFACLNWGISKVFGLQKGDDQYFWKIMPLEKKGKIAGGGILK